MSGEVIREIDKSTPGNKDIETQYRGFMICSVKQNKTIDMEVFPTYKAALNTILERLDNGEYTEDKDDYGIAEVVSIWHAYDGIVSWEVKNISDEDRKYPIGYKE